jgi:hypothetical protein
VKGFVFGTMERQAWDGIYVVVVVVVRLLPWYVCVCVSFCSGCHFDLDGPRVTGSVRVPGSRFAPIGGTCVRKCRRQDSQSVPEL